MSHRSLAPLALALALALAACAGPKQPPKEGPSPGISALPLPSPSEAPAPPPAPAPTASASAAAAPVPAPTSSASAAAAPVPAGARAVVLRHGPMTYVMDTPPNQLRKAKQALEGSALAKALASLGIAVTYEGDPKLGDGVIVLAGEKELGRGELRDLTDADPPASLLADVKRHFGL